MTLTQLLKESGRDIKNITKIYHGKDNWCRCGCGGSYWEANVPEEARGFNRAINLLEKEERFDFAVRADEIYVGDTYINIPYGDEERNDCYCLYFD